jgi:hypothetical protein
MKRSLITIAAGLGLSLFSPALFAAASTYNVPFAFNASGVQLAAGKYTVSTNQQSGNLSGHNGGVMFLNVPDLESKPGPAHLTFYKQGGTYFLREVWQVNGIGSRIRPGSREREMTKNQQAQNNATKVVLVATR